jgi:hypothetical protein
MNIIDDDPTARKPIAKALSALLKRATINTMLKNCHVLLSYTPEVLKEMLCLMSDAL